LALSIESLSLSPKGAYIVCMPFNDNGHVWARKHEIGENIKFPDFFRQSRAAYLEQQVLDNQLPAKLHDWNRLF
jgi:hypothetical protein